jgi:alkylation response protein AidB-like acyl-CoA dehydrogenase
VTTTAQDSAFIEAVASLVKAGLAPKARAIDEDGLYPRDWLDDLGELGGFAAAIPAGRGGLGLGLAAQIEATTQVGIACGSTAFLTWCQSCCAWYLLHAPNAAIRERYLADVAQGRLKAGTGMSNSVKHLAGIEKIHLQARRDGDDYLIDGILPWVSNVGQDHLLITTAAADDGYVMFALTCDAPSLELHPCQEFSGMEGTQTLNLRFNGVRVRPADVLAYPAQFDAYIRRIKPGFVLGQTGMAFGVTRGCLQTIQECNAISRSPVNAFLDDQGSELADELARLEQRTAALARQADAGQAPLLDVLTARAQASELALRAANSAVLHAGAKGYLKRHPAQRRLREAVFVAIVTPALKHLRKEIHDLRQGQSVPVEQVRQAQAA